MGLSILEHKEENKAVPIVSSVKSVLGLPSCTSKTPLGKGIQEGRRLLYIVGVSHYLLPCLCIIIIANAS